MSESSGEASADVSEAIVAAANSVRRSWLTRLLTQALLIAVPGGVVFSWAMWLVRGIDPVQFDQLLRGTTPGTLGWWAFLLLFVLQVVASAALRPHR